MGAFSLLASLSVDRFLSDKLLAITVGGLEELRGHILGRLARFDAEPNAAVADMLAQLGAKARVRAGAATSTTGVIPIRGTISQHSQGDLSSMLFGGASTEAITADLRAMLADDTIDKIVLDIDSPGGSVAGVTELATEIRQSRSQKPIIGVANGLAASAAYHIGSACSQFYCTPSGLVGSIGIIAVHQDISKAAEQAGVSTSLITAGKFKAAGNQFAPLDDATRARVQARVDEAYQTFTHDVALGRGVPVDAVRNGFGEGDVLTAKAALAEGMVDGIRTFDAVCAMDVAGMTGRMKPTMAADAKDEPELGDPESIDTAGEERLNRMRLSAFRSRVAAAGAA